LRQFTTRRHGDYIAARRVDVEVSKAFGRYKLPNNRLDTTGGNGPPVFLCLENAEAICHFAARVSAPVLGLKENPPMRSACFSLSSRSEIRFRVFHARFRAAALGWTIAKPFLTLARPPA
jgi:hypothetical protein